MGLVPGVIKGLGITLNEAKRTVFPEVPVRVEYKLTPKGLRMGDLFLPIIAHLRITGWREGLATPAPSGAARGCGCRCRGGRP